MNAVKLLLITGVVALLAACQSAATPTAAPTAAPKPTVAPAEPTPAAAAGPFDGWVAFSPDDGSFKLLLPARPELQTQELPDLGTLNIYMTTARDNASAYGVMFNDLAADAVNQSSAQDLLETTMNGAAQRVGTELLGSRATDVQGYPALDFAVQIPAQSDLPDGGVYATRIILVNNRLYQLIVTQAGEGDQALISAFLDSFSVTQ